MGRPDKSDDDGSSSSSSSSLDDNNDKHDGRRDERKKSTKNKHHKKKKKRSRHHDDSKEKDKKKKRRRREEDYTSESDSISGSSHSRSNSNNDDDDDGHRKKKQRHKKDERRERSKDKKKKKKSKHNKRHDRHHEKKKRSKRRRTDDSDDSNGNNGNHDDAFARNHALAAALSQVLDSHPPLIADLPIMLMRLAGGTTFDLSQMTDPTAAQGIASIFGCLESYGVQRDATTGAWMWKGPQSQQRNGGGGGGGSSSNDLVLVRVVRTLLDQIGITNEALTSFESDELKRKQEALKRPPPPPPPPSEKAAVGSASSRKEDPIIGQVKQLFADFDQSLGKELAVLCNMILEGESVALDGLPDERLRMALESLFDSCGLEQCEMEKDDDDDDDSLDDDEEQDDEKNEAADETPSMGYGLPENSKGTTTARVRLESILSACQQQQHTPTASATTERPARGRVLGPSLPPAGGYEQEEESDEEGPQLTAPSAGPDVADAVRVQAARRARELRAVNAGLSAKDAAAMDEAGGREEWMIVPGQYDFLDGIKSAPIKNRKFQGGSKHDKDKQQQSSGPVDPAVQAEMDAILQAHQDSRGPSLMDEHRAAKAAAEAEKKKKGKGNNWKWTRDKDLDEGRRVDKDALSMVMGGAANGLQSKFQGGFNSGR